MFGIGFTELLLVLVVALLVLGPDKLPEVARSMAKAYNELRRTGHDLKRTVEGLDIASTIGNVMEKGGRPGASDGKAKSAAGPEKTSAEDETKAGTGTEAKSRAEAETKTKTETKSEGDAAPGPVKAPPGTRAASAGPGADETPGKAT